ncbi:DNA-binding transcriptional regulator, GntR family [Duganella sp. CF402]|uniref:GntR family transcriptional regulator n=1 Tax=unclassified Duganella TaxID=2636909 RepID=UPI0008CD9841|nr:MULTISPECIES: GntR family transcriptional regulator [unclassified Duganella]RZT08222.1 GntR family transcriptional regulator [Duganella sp. BK701]SEM01646.1 DNA-binding transcriptional regulator, GntR family [Duganella sp. CF402]
MDWENPQPQFELDKTQNAANQVYLHLREQILRMGLKPGTPLSRAELASYYGVSGTPVRDATLRLAEEGLVDIFPQHGTRVSGIDIDAAKHAHFLRLSLELEIARKLSGETDRSLVNELYALIEKQRGFLKMQNFDGFVFVDLEFHHRLFVAAQMEDLWVLMRSKSGHLDRLRRMHVPLNGKADAVLQEHTDLVSAIEKGSAYGAEAVVRRHLSGTMSKLRALRERYPGLLIPESTVPPELITSSP